MLCINEVYITET